MVASFSEQENICEASDMRTQQEVNCRHLSDQWDLQGKMLGEEMILVISKNSFKVMLELKKEDPSGAGNLTQKRHCDQFSYLNSRQINKKVCQSPSLDYQYQFTIVSENINVVQRKYCSVFVRL